MQRVELDCGALFGPRWIGERAARALLEALWALETLPTLSFAAREPRVRTAT